MKNKQLIKGLGMAAVVAAVVVPVGVNADDLTAVNKTTGEHTATVQLEQGEFTLKTSGVNDFGSHKITAQQKTVTSGFDGLFNVIDARGTQEGWNVTVEASPFTIVEPAGGWVQANPYSLPLGSLTLGTLTSVVGVHGEEAAIHPTAQSLGVAIDLGQNVKVASAANGQGMGEYDMGFANNALSLVIDPTTAKIDKVNYPTSVTPYESTLTWNLVTGP